MQSSQVICPVEVTLSFLSGKWSVLILRDLFDGKQRFGALQRSLGGISQKVLTSHLRDLEARGLVHRQVFAEVPVRVEYSLTELGESLRPVVDSMYAWGEFYRASVGEI